MLFAKVTHPERGYDNDKEYIKRLDFDIMYPVTLVSMGQSHTHIELEGVKGYYNSIQFTFYEGEGEEDAEEINLGRSFTYNPYLGGRGTAYTEVR
jgi:hypothetical protein